MFYERVPGAADLLRGVLSVLANAAFQGYGELCKHFFLACAALRYPQLAPRLDEEATPILFRVHVQYHVVFDPIQRNVGGLGS